MISGFLLLDEGKEEPLGVFYSKRASRILIPLIFWSLSYSVWTIVESWGEQGIQSAFLEAGKNIIRVQPLYLENYGAMNTINCSTQYLLWQAAPIRSPLSSPRLCKERLCAGDLYG